MAKKVTKRQAARLKGYRSGLEEFIDTTLKSVGVDGAYEQHKIAYTKPATQHKYTPDFRLPNGIYIETNGRFVTADNVINFDEQFEGYLTTLLAKLPQATVIKSVCPNCKADSAYFSYKMNSIECMRCGTPIGQTVL